MLAEDWDVRDTLVCVSTGKRKDEDARLRYPRELYVKGPEAMTELFADVPEALANTVKIAERCNVELDFNANHTPLVGIERCEADDSAGSADAPEGSTEWFKRFCSTYKLVPIDSTKGDAPSSKDLKQQCDQSLRELCEASLKWRYGASPPDRSCGGS